MNPHASSAEGGLYYCVYVSSASELLQEEDLECLVEICRQNNESTGTTGMLVYLEGNFLQLLEGRKAEIEHLLERIKADPRHRGVEVLLQGSLLQRCFSGSPMAFRDLGKVRPGALDDDSRFLSDLGDAVELARWPRKAHRLLLSFCAMQTAHCQ